MKYVLPAVMLFAAAAAYASVPNPKAGKWQHQGKVVSAKIPGVPDFIARSVAAPKSRSSCLTAAQSASQPANLFITPEMDCGLGGFSMSNGQISGATTCTFKKTKDKLAISSSGTYNASSYSMRNVTTGKRNGKPMTIITTSTGSWKAASCK